MPQNSDQVLSESGRTLVVGGGEMGERTGTFDWATTPVGCLATWPQSLKIVVRIMLDSRYAMWLGWGAEFTFFYNDAYARMTLGPKHPWALGRPAREVWPEIWDDIGPRAESVVRTGEATWDEGLLLFLQRRGFAEETYHTFSYSPIPDDDGTIGGMLCVVTEDTERTIGERRLRTLRELAAHTNEAAKSAEEACQIAARTLGENRHDLPFLLIYLLDADGKIARLTGATGLEAGSTASPSKVELEVLSEDQYGWPFQAVLKAGRAEVVSDLIGRFGKLPAGIWPQSPEQAMVLPLAKPGQTRLAGFVIAGASPRLVLDDAYKGFMDLLAGQVATAVANARAYEEERKRAEILAELDRAKTVFFSNVSHEFRTPLTLMLGPVEEMLADTEAPLTPRHRVRLEVAHRNAMRLRKLVNALLDFSRIEAGRVQAYFEPTDLSSLTADLASNFRSACERAGIALRVDCPPLPETVYVDPNMWEKVVLNLVSNAFKYTLDGSIEVTMRPVGNQAIFEVRDTGTGIPPDQLPLLFQRFHRVEGAQGRTQEGTGIGLALVRELVNQHGGEVQAASELGKGSVFSVSIPFGNAHLSADRLRPAGSAALPFGALTYVEEAMQWLPADQAWTAELHEELATSPIGTMASPAVDRPRVLLADDNADMRGYIVRLLSRRYEVAAVSDGVAALRAAQLQPPDLILSDVMMPGLSGLELLKALRSDPRTAAAPILLLSARAGEEAHVEGLQAGADDYLTKPFSAKELLARVQAHLALAKLRREASEALQRSEWFHRLISELTSDFTFSIRFGKDKTSSVVDFISPGFTSITGYTLEELNRRGGWPTIIYPDDLPVPLRTVERMFAGQQDEAEARLIAKDGTVRWVRYLSHPVLGGDGAVTGFVGAAQHISDRKLAEDFLRETSATLRSFYDTSPVMMGVVEVDATDNRVRHITDNAATYRFLGIQSNLSQALTDQNPWQAWMPHYRESVCTEQPVRFDYPHTLGNKTHWLSVVVYCIKRMPNGHHRCSYVAEDVTERKRIEAALQKQSERLRLLWEAATVLLTTEDPDSMVRGLFARIAPHFSLDAYFNFLVNDSGDALRMGSCTGIPKEEAEKITRLEFGQAVCGTAALRRQPIAATHIQQSGEPMVQLVKSFGIKAYACNPLLAEGRLIGTLSFASRSKDEFEPDELEFLATICRYVTVAYERLRLVHQLRDQDRRKDEFLATLAHELRNPLAPIRNSLQILKMPRLDSATLERSREMMERQVHQLVRLVDDLLDVSRVMRGKIELRKETIELATVLARAVETIQPLADAQGHQLIVHLPTESLLLNADPVRLTQVVGNLLTNAAKYTEPNGSIWLTASREQDEAVLRVRDNGIGIGAEMLPHIFDLFVQVDHAATRSQGGLGIGLTLVKNLVGMHHGKVEALSSGLGLGSEFIVRLPLLPQVQPETLEKEVCGDSPFFAARSSGHRLLVVDDNRDAADSLAMLLRLQGHDVRIANDGPAALEIAQGFLPTIVFLDLGMPVMDGYEVARRLRRQPGMESVRLAALTGWGQQEDRRRTKEAGFDVHLVKPVEPHTLEGLVAQLTPERC